MDLLGHRLTTGMVLTNPGPFWRELDAVRRRIAELGSQRIELPGELVLDLKPDWQPGRSSTCD